MQAHENTKTHICQYGFVSRSNWNILWVKLPKRYQTAIEPAPSLCCFCLSGRDFFFRDVSTETGLTLICQQCLSWCHDRHTHTTWEAEFLFHPPSFLHIVVFVCCLLSALCIRVKLLEGVKDGRREVHEMSKRQRNGGVCFSETGFSASFLFPLTGSKKEKKKTA